MTDIDALTKEILKFRDERNWKQFHNPKDLAISLSMEAAEVLEHMQWRNGKDLQAYVAKHKKEIGEELCDVLFNVLLLSHELGIDIKQAFPKKMEKNRKKYPIGK